MAQIGQPDAESAATPDATMSDLVGAVEARLQEIKAKLAQGEAVGQGDLEPIGDDVAQMFVQVSVIASWE